MNEPMQLELPCLPPVNTGEALPIQGLVVLPFVGQCTYDGNIKRFNCWNKGQVVNADRILEFFEYLEHKRNFNPNTLVNYHYSIKAALKKGLRDIRHIMALDTFFGQIKHIKQDLKIYEESVITKTEFEKLKENSPPKIALISTVLYHSGMRISELLGIRIKDCELSGKYVYASILGKGSKMRRVVITRSVFEEITKVFRSREFLFQSPSKKSRAYNREHIARQIKRYAGLTFPDIRIHPHTFRHSFATRHIKAKGSVKAVANYLGHAGTSITEQMYVHDQMGLDELWPITEEKDTEAA